MPTGRIAATFCAAIALALALVAPAPAAVTIGQAPPVDGDLGDCGPAYMVQISNAVGPGYVVPAPGGVLTRWRTTATGELSFLLWREESSLLTLVASDARTVSGGGEFAVRIPVSGGEHLGLGSKAKEFLDCRIFTKLGKDLIGVTGETEIGGTPAMLEEGGLRLSVAADIEPDADHDGYGDETQDACPADASRQGPCADVDPPETAIAKHPKKTSSNRRVKFRFSADEPGSTFECKLDKRPFKPCRSPVKRTVGTGRHRFKVRAVDAAGNRDPSPAVFSWTVVE
jgi:hypothetical protein